MTLIVLWVAQHEHDDEVGSFAIERDGDLDPELFNGWLGQLLREKGIDLFRMKGFLSLWVSLDATFFRGFICFSMLSRTSPGVTSPGAIRLSSLAVT